MDNLLRRLSYNQTNEKVNSLKIRNKLVRITREKGKKMEDYDIGSIGLAAGKAIENAIKELPKNIVATQMKIRVDLRPSTGQACYLGVKASITVPVKSEATIEI